jgi:hypothetical protein
MKGRPQLLIVDPSPHDFLSVSLDNTYDTTSVYAFRNVHGRCARELSAKYGKRRHGAIVRSCSILFAVVDTADDCFIRVKSMESNINPEEVWSFPDGPHSFMFSVADLVFGGLVCRGRTGGLVPT